MEALIGNSPLTARLLGNHLEFLRTHRGDIVLVDSGVAVESEKTQFTYLIAGRAAVSDAALEAQRCIHRLPWSGIDGATLERAGFAKQSALAYMTCPATFAAAPPSGDVTVEAVATHAALEDFTEVQSRAFLEEPEDHAAWHPFLRAANFVNFRNVMQRFYVARERERAVSVALAVRTGRTVGIYAVGTRPEERRRGLARLVMSRAIRDARAQYDCDLVTLQVMAGSAVERLYLEWGFQRAFAADVFVRQEMRANA